MHGAADLASLPAPVPPLERRAARPVRAGAPVLPTLRCGTLRALHIRHRRSPYLCNSLISLTPQLSISLSPCLSLSIALSLSSFPCYSLFSFPTYLSHCIYLPLSLSLTVSHCLSLSLPLSLPLCVITHALERKCALLHSSPSLTHRGDVAGVSSHPILAPSPPIPLFLLL